MTVLLRAVRLLHLYQKQTAVAGYGDVCKPYRMFKMSAQDPALPSPGLLGDTESLRSGTDRHTVPGSQGTCGQPGRPRPWVPATPGRCRWRGRGLGSAGNAPSGRQGAQEAGGDRTEAQRGMGDRRAAGGSGKLGSLSKGDGRAGLGKTEAGRAHPGDLVYVRLKPGRGWGRGSGVE